MGMLDDARKAQAEAEAAVEAEVRAMREGVGPERIARDRPVEDEQRQLMEDPWVALQQGRRLTEEFLNEVRRRHLEPNFIAYVETRKVVWVNRRRPPSVQEMLTAGVKVGKDRKGYPVQLCPVVESISRIESGRYFGILCHHLDDKTGQLVEVKHVIDPTTGKEVVSQETVTQAPSDAILPAIMRWIRWGRTETEIHTISPKQRPMENHRGLAIAMLDFLQQAR